MTTTLLSPFSPDECLERVRMVSEPAQWVTHPFRRVLPPLVSGTKNGVFWVSKNRAFINPLRPVLRGRLEPHGRETLITSRFEVHPVNFWLLVLWYGFLGFLLFFRAPGAAAGFEKTWQFIMKISFLFALPTFLWALGTWLARGERRFLLEAITAILNASPVLWDDRRPGGGGKR